MSQGMVKDPRISSFHHDVQAALTGNGILVEPDTIKAYTENVSGFHREVPLVLLPQTRDEVVAIVGIANKHRVPLYPVSTGRNWGLGSRLPVTDGCVIVDLSRMQRISEVNNEFGFAVIEPGVTQGQLAEYLTDTGSAFFLDVTGAGRATSVIGNTLERGVGYHMLRAETLIALEVVLGTGNVLRTGYSHFPSCRTASLSPHGVGPSVSGLFFQSNYGIVTAATIKLLPRAEHTVAFSLSFPNQRLGPVVDAIRRLKQHHVVEGVVHIGNRRRGHISLAPMIYDYYRTKGVPITKPAVDGMVTDMIRGDWTAFGHVSGDREQCRHAARRIARALSSLGKVSLVSQRELSLFRKIAETFRRHKMASFLAAVGTLFQLTGGEPTDEALKSIIWPRVVPDDGFQDPDRGQVGILFCVPILPMREEDAVEVSAIATSVAQKHGFEAAITLNTLQATCLEGVISIDFLKADFEASARANRWLEEMHATYRDRGIYPLRLDIGNMSTLVTSDDVFWQTTGDLKRSLDPNNIIAPGRYQPHRSLEQW
jgi:4-cresol dehydrogenase (hydroxylating) flavoprotein subunit